MFFAIPICLLFEFTLFLFSYLLAVFLIFCPKILYYKHYLGLKLYQCYFIKYLFFFFHQLNNSNLLINLIKISVSYFIDLFSYIFLTTLIFIYDQFCFRLIVFLSKSNNLDYWINFYLFYLNFLLFYLIQVFLVFFYKFPQLFCLILNFIT